jgi:hypothetical protein
MYFDHQEFGGHYFRAMSAWGIVNAALGLSICGDTYTFAPRLGGASPRFFFSFGKGTAHYTRTVSKTSESVTVDVHSGSFRCRELRLETRRAPGKKTAVCIGKRVVSPRTYELSSDGSQLVVRFDKPIDIAAGRSISVKV